MIQLGLSRIHKLFDPQSIIWKAIHVAGTNGKGSVCAYASAMLKSAGLKVGRFTSPHLVDRWDCIQIDGKTIDQKKFEDVERKFIERNKLQKISATEFEVLTATAFEAFNEEKVDVGVVEVGVGGRDDATNIIPPENTLISVITKIAMDHESLLGSSIEEVARHKAGIIKSSVPCVYDATNEPSVVSTLKKAREESNSLKAVKSSLKPVEMRFLGDNVLSNGDLDAFFQGSRPADHQLMAMSLAVSAVDCAIRRLLMVDDTEVKLLSELATVLPSCQWPGRLQWININRLTGRSSPVLLDGAHNLDSAGALATFIDRQIRRDPSTSLSWVFAASTGKDVLGMARKLIKDNDTVTTTQFGPVDSMPWVAPMDARELLSTLQGHLRLDPRSRSFPEVFDAVDYASSIAGEGPMVIAGSLYLASDVLRSLR